MRIWSSMVYAFRRSIGVPSDHGRLAILVRRSRGMASSYVSLCAVVVAVAGLSLAVVPATASAEPLCTDSWTGPAEGSWQTASNWSKEEVPGSSDVACIGSGKTVQVTGGSNQASSVQGEGALTISGGSMELVDALETSSIGGLGIGGGTLSIAGTFGSPAPSLSAGRQLSPARVSWWSTQPYPVRLVRGLIVRCIRR
jgi:hypothetical protein